MRVSQVMIHSAYLKSVEVGEQYKRSDGIL